jgi:DNA-binding winged helix-turn-helix (wHTH) protein/tetratricopeptide (TPR) repeat protein
MPFGESDVVAFERCELRLATQELYRDGKRVDVEPKALTLLRYLIENRERTISKDELLTNVWKTIHLSDGVVARAVMKLRRAVGDSDEAPHILRTQHRVGYRFIAELRVPEAHPAAQPLPATAPTLAPKLVILPIQNRSGDARSDWVELGLMSMVHRALESSGMELVPVTNMLRASEGLDAHLAAAQRAAVLRRRLGTEWALAMEVYASNGAFELRWILMRHETPFAEAAESGADLVGLAMAAAQQIHDRLSERGVQARLYQCDLGDAFLNEAFARSQKALLEGRSGDALALIRVCLLAPDRPLEVDLAYFTMLVELREAASIELGDELLAKIGERANSPVLASVHINLALALQHNGRSAEALAHLEQASALLSGSRSGEQLYRLNFVKASVAIRVLDFSSAREGAQHVLADAEAAGDNLHASRALNLMGAIEERSGYIERALSFFNSSVERTRSHGFTRDLYLALTNVAEMHLHFGDVEQARSVLAECATLVERNETRQTRRRTAWLHFAIAMLVGTWVVAQRRLEELDETARGGAILDAESLHYSRAQLLLAGPSPAEAANSIEALGRVVIGPEVSPHLLPMRLAFELRCGRGRDAKRVLDSFATAVRRLDDPLLDGVLLGCRAQWHYAEGNHAEALSSVRRALEILPSPSVAPRPGLYPFALDAIWFALEASQIDVAQELEGLVAPWLGQTVRGLEVAARLRFHQARFAEAAELQQHSVELEGERARALSRNWLLAYQVCARDKRALRLEPSPLSPALP